MPSKLVMMTWNDDDGMGNFPVHPDNSLPGTGRPVYPSNGLPGGPINLPVFPFDPTRPDNSLPEPPSSTLPIRPGVRFVVKWLACQGLILVPDNTLPTTPPSGSIDNTLPETPEPK